MEIAFQRHWCAKLMYENLVKTRLILPRQRQATHIFDDLPKIDWTWLGSFDAPTVLPGPCTVYHLFWSLQNFLDGKKLAKKRAAEYPVAKFFATKPQKFYTNGIMKLPEKWQKVKDNYGTYALIVTSVSRRRNFSEKRNNKSLLKFVCHLKRP